MKSSRTPIHTFGQIKGLLAALFLLAIAASCSKSEEAGGGAPPLPVEVGLVEELELPLYFETIGNVMAKSFVEIKPQVEGILEKALVVEGQLVKRGEPLFLIDSRIYRAALDQAAGNLEKAEAALENAKIVVARNEDLVKKNYIPLLTFEQYETDVKKAGAEVKIGEAELERAKINLDYCKITSPIDGVVSAFSIYPGNYVLQNGSSTIAEIRQIDPIEVRFSLTQNEFRSLQKAALGGNLEFEASFSRDYSEGIRGKVSFVDNKVDLKTGTIALKGEVENRGGALWPGEFVQVRVAMREREKFLTLPAAAVEIGAVGPYAYLVQSDMTVKAITLKTGETVGDRVILLSGLKKGDRVVTNGQLNLRNGSLVAITNRSLD